MVTPEEIIDRYDLSIDAEMYHPFVEAMKEYAQEVAKEALKNASENVSYVCGSSRKVKGKYTESCGKWCGGCDSVIVNKQSILNESNIPTL